MTIDRAARRWLIAAAALGVIVAGLWASGGLASDRESLGRHVDAGEPLTGRRWELDFGAAHIDRDRDDPRIVVELTGTFNGEKTAVAPGDGIVVLELADGTRLTEFTWRSEPGFGQPGVRAPAELHADVPGLPPGDQPIVIGVFDERRIESFIQGDLWIGAMPIGQVRLTARDIS